MMNKALLEVRLVQAEEYSRLMVRNFRASFKENLEATTNEDEANTLASEALTQVESFKAELDARLKEALDDGARNPKLTEGDFLTLA
jgi:predicted signal transduction protein with EAL and GGDEF domain